ncbi:RNA polymerase sigma-54 factor RpoN [Legionella pneumophila subsp. pneumophila LPE509]|nr:RNA polymerase sigma-54 factor RpoN [Legionella pneumophila subsp. pneumophila LPE509]
MLTNTNLQCRFHSNPLFFSLSLTISLNDPQGLSSAYGR